jgi:hypothetical protein
MKISRCKGCDAEIIWCETQKGRQICLDADFVASSISNDMEHDDAPIYNHALHKAGVHWDHCPNAADFRHRRP